MNGCPWSIRGSWNSERRYIDYPEADNGSRSVFCYLREENGIPTSWICVPQRRLMTRDDAIRSFKDVKAIATLDFFNWI